MAAREATATARSIPLTPEDIADAAEARVATFGRNPVDKSIAVVDGMGAQIRVRAGALVVEDGMGEDRRTRRFEKIDALRRLVVLSDYGGFLSLDALRWCRRTGLTVLFLAPDGTPTFASVGYGSDDARLRRAQVAAYGSETGLRIIRQLLRAKLAGEADVAREVLGSPETGDLMDTWAEALDGIGSPEDARAIEAQAGQAYFSAWPKTEALRFVAKDLSRVPAHWRRFEGRRSALRSGSRNLRAERPLNAILNYVYRLAEAEARVALLAVGLDPGLGFLHADYPGRDALALDLMETARPAVERYVLQLAAKHRFRKRDFTEGPDGHVRLLAPLTHVLAETMPAWAEVAAPHAEAIAHTLAEDVLGRIPKRTPLTSKRRRDAVRRVRTPRERSTKAALPQPVCAGCGAPLDRPDYTWCEECRPAVKQDALAKAGQRSAAVRRVRRAAGLPDPSTAPEVRAKVGAAIGARDAEAMAWDAAHAGIVADPERFAPIAARLSSVTLGRIMAATGLSKSYAASVRRGEHVPHPRHWPPLADLTGVVCPFKDGIGAGRLDLTWWREVVVPALASVTTSAVSEATRLSNGQASKIRRGLSVPEPKHWRELAELAGVGLPIAIEQASDSHLRFPGGTLTTGIADL